MKGLVLEEVGQGNVLDSQSGLLVHISHFSMTISLVRKTALRKMNPFLQAYLPLSPPNLDPDLLDLPFQGPSPSLRTHGSQLCLLVGTFLNCNPRPCFRILAILYGAGAEAWLNSTSLY